MEGVAKFKDDKGLLTGPICWSLTDRKSRW